LREVLLDGLDGRFCLKVGGAPRAPRSAANGNQAYPNEVATWCANTTTL
jgi:hypothetical protein